MKKNLLTIVFLISALTIKAQNVPLPEVAGKYIFELMVNRSDISKSLVHTDFDNYAALYKKIWLPYFQRELDNASENEKIFTQIEIEGIDSKSEFIYTNEIKNTWAILLQNADMMGINKETATYNKTFFKLRKDQNDEYPKGGIEMHVSMNYNNSIYAFLISTQWVDNKWIVMNVSPNIYEYVQREHGELVFEPKTDNESAFEEINYEFNETISAPMEACQTIDSPDTFNQEILSLLLNGTSFGSNNLFLTAGEYMEYLGNIILDQVKNKIESENLDKKSLGIFSQYIENPLLFYETEFVRSWEELQENLKEEFEENDISYLTPYETTTEISNSDIKFKNLDNITVETRMNFIHNGHNAGILFKAIWLDGMWKLSSIQPFPYGITVAVNAV